MKTWTKWYVMEWILIFIVVSIIGGVGAHVKSVDPTNWKEVKAKLFSRGDKDKQLNNNVAITCYSEAEVIRQERLRCEVIVRNIRDLCICEF